MRYFLPPADTRFYAGVDLQARSLFLCILDTDGHARLARNLPAAPEPKGADPFSHINPCVPYKPEAQAKDAISFACASGLYDDNALSLLNFGYADLWLWPG